MQYKESCTCAIPWAALILYHFYAVQLRVLTVKHTISFFIILWPTSWKEKIKAHYLKRSH